MKTLKTKLHRKIRTTKHAAATTKDAAEVWAMDHDLADPDLQMLRIERSPKQENL